jgi:SAM-dependent methyltransferase
VRNHDEEKSLRARCWDEVAAAYEGYFVPRFRPWVIATVEAVMDRELPEGRILVPCCGTFPELPELAARFPDREIAGIDISPGMIARARQRAESWPAARALVQDAAVLDPGWTGACAAVVSVFGLQQLPEPETAISEWTRALVPGGQLAVTFWPDDRDAAGPWGVLDQVLAKHVPARDVTWENRLAAAVRAAGATIRRDERLAFPMTHPDAASMWEAMTTGLGGALRITAMRQGPQFMADLRADFIRSAPDGEWRHRPQARLIVAGK